MFIARRCRATGLSAYASPALTNRSAISVSAVPRMMRACRSRSACAWRLIASSSSCGIFTSWISTEWTVMPHGFVFSSRIFWSSLPSCSRSVIISAS